MNVLVTGATGFLGRRTVEILKDQNFSPVALGRNLQSLEKLSQQGVPSYQVDLSEIPQLEKIHHPIEAVVHCAALSSQWGAYQDFYRGNVLATQNLLKFCQRKGIKRFVHISTPSVYVRPEHQMNITEAGPLPKKPINFYAATKLQAEQLVRGSGLNHIILRPQGLIGPGDGSIFPRLQRLAQKKMIPVVGRGDNLIDLTFVDNVVRAIELSLQAQPFAWNEVYNITNGEPLENYKMLEHFFKQLGFPYQVKKVSFRKLYAFATLLEYTYRGLGLKREPILTRYAACVLSLSRTLSIDKAKDRLGFKPQVSMEEGLERYIDWCRKKIKEDGAYGR